MEDVTNFGNQRWQGLSRRSFLRAFGMGIAMVPMLATAPTIAGTLPQSKTTGGGKKHLPNVVFILADDMGYGDIHALAPKTCQIPTPELDRLAAGGMTFTEAHSGSAVCTPTRYGLLTGRYAWRTRLKRHVLKAYDRPLIEDGRETVASLLKRRGYATACIGKWHLGMDLPTTDGKPAGRKNVDWAGRIGRSPLSNGFDSFFGILGSLDMDPFIWVRNDRFVGTCTTVKTWVSRGPAEASFEAVDVLPRLGDEAERFIRSRKGKAEPFFLYLPLSAPHVPIVPSKAFQGKSGIGAYGDFCMEIDSVVGRVRAALEEIGCLEETLLIFSADNGCAYGANLPHLAKQGHFPSAGRRGYKTDVYDGGHRVPFVVHWPATVAPGSKTHHPICLTDFFATCAELVGFPLGNDMAEDSASFLPLLKGMQPPTPLHEAIVHHSGDGSFAIRKGKWKLLLCPGSGGNSPVRNAQAVKQGLPPTQLFDVEADPAEKTNLQAQHPEVVKALTALLERYKTSGRSVPMR